jgi:broad-specificity NMP kinase
MAAYLITGSPGVGNTTVDLELQKRGFASYNSDDVESIKRYVNVQTKQIVPKPSEPMDYKVYGTTWDLPSLQKFLQSADPLFLAGIAFNVIDALELFTTVFVLSIPLSALRHRVTSRTNNDYGKQEEVLDRILRDHEGSDDFWRNKGAVIIDANRPVEAVADDILQYIIVDTI